MKKVIVFALAALTFAACQESLEEKAAREAELYTKKNCPSLIAKNMTMDSLTFEANTHTLHFYYTLSGEADTVGVMNHRHAGIQGCWLQLRLYLPFTEESAGCHLPDRIQRKGL